MELFGNIHNMVRAVSDDFVAAQAIIDEFGHSDSRDKREIMAHADYFTTPKVESF